MPHSMMKIDMKLIEEIKKHEFLYNLKSTDYKNRAKKDRVWEEIAEFLDLEVHICQKRWKNLRDTYKKHKWKMQQYPEEFGKRRPWTYFERLTFLDDVQSTRSIIRKRFKAIDEEDTEEDCSQTTRDSYTIEEPLLDPPSPPLKRSRQSSFDSKEEMPQEFEEIFNKPSLSISGDEEYAAVVKSKNCTYQLFEALANKVTSSNLTNNQINDIESSVFTTVYKKLSEIQSYSNPQHK